jgi:ATP diphosphatase
MQPSRDIGRLIEIVAALRRPLTGCGWDIEQTFESMSLSGLFDFGDVVEMIAQKMIRRHPHVFAATGDRSPEQVTRKTTRSH